MCKWHKTQSFTERYKRYCIAVFRQSLASIFQDLLANTKDDYLRAVRALFREIVRAVRNDINFVEFAMGLMTERTDAKIKDLEQQHKVCVTNTDNVIHRCTCIA